MGSDTSCIWCRCCRRVALPKLQGSDLHGLQLQLDVVWSPMGQPMSLRQWRAAISSGLETADVSVLIGVCAECWKGRYEQAWRRQRKVEILREGM